MLEEGAAVSAFRAAGAEVERFADGVVCSPAMNAGAKALAEGIEVRSQVEVERVAGAPGGLELFAGGQSAGVFERVAVTAPAPQAANLLADVAPALADRAAQARFAPCLAVMAAWEDERLPGDVDLIRDPSPEAELAWAVRESAKPGREPGERWTLQAGPRWSEEHLEDEPIEVERHLLGALGVALQAGGALPPPDFLATHRWRYSRVTEALDEPYLLDEVVGIGATGDWCGGGGGVDRALAGGEALADGIISGRP
ncbi:MAG: NAD(P)/FAD-dependent oxidoreductase, partial [Solirubrobacterales bacterium]